MAIREVIFRGKRTDNGEWETGSLVIIRDGCSDKEVFIADKMTGYHTPVIPETVGQYTGLTDKNGVRIFEGDIVANDKGDIGRVTWYEEYSAFMIYNITENKVYWLYDNDFSLIEVIGNIHDNPELLRGGADNDR